MFQHLKQYRCMFFITVILIIIFCDYHLMHHYVKGTCNASITYSTPEVHQASIKI